jgi:hypothetical protein
MPSKKKPLTPEGAFAVSASFRHFLSVPAFRRKSPVPIHASIPASYLENVLVIKAVPASSGVALPSFAGERAGGVLALNKSLAQLLLSDPAFPPPAGMMTPPMSLGSSAANSMASLVGETEEAAMPTEKDKAKSKRASLLFFSPAKPADSEKDAKKDAKKEKKEEKKKDEKKPKKKASEKEILEEGYLPALSLQSPASIPAIQLEMQARLDVLPRLLAETDGRASVEAGEREEKERMEMRRRNASIETVDSLLSLISSSTVPSSTCEEHEAVVSAPAPAEPEAVQVVTPPAERVSAHIVTPPAEKEPVEPIEPIAEKPESANDPALEIFVAVAPETVVTPEIVVSSPLKSRRTTRSSSATLDLEHVGHPMPLSSSESSSSGVSNAVSDTVVAEEEKLAEERDLEMEMEESEERQEEDGSAVA